MTLPIKPQSLEVPRFSRGRSRKSSIDHAQMENKCSSRVEHLSARISHCSQSRSDKLIQGENAESETSSIISACRELEALLTSPEDWISKVAGSYNNAVALCLVLDLGIPKLLSERKLTCIETLMDLSGASISVLSNDILQMMVMRF